MPESTRFKELPAKIETLIAVMDQRDETMKSIEQSLATSNTYHVTYWHSYSSSNSRAQKPTKNLNKSNLSS